MAFLEVPLLMGEVPAPVREARERQDARGTGTHAVRRADRSQVQAYQRLRRDVFVHEQGLFAGSDADELDDDPRTIVLVAVAPGPDARVLGGVRLAPATAGRDLGWWTGSRLVVDRAARGAAGIGADLVRAACAEALERGVLRFEASVQAQNETMFRRLGWVRWAEESIHGMPHVRMRWPIDRVAQLASTSKAHLAELLDPFESWGDASEHSLGGAGFVGDDGAPVPGTDVIAACDAILPAMIEHDPEWAGWCAVLVNVNDLSAMGAHPVGLLNSLAARDIGVARQMMAGLRAGSQAWGIPVLGGHTQIGMSAALSVTALGRVPAAADGGPGRAVPGGGGRPGHAVSVTADLTGDWRPGFESRQWDSTSARTGEELRRMARIVAEAQPAAAKDISMAGLVGSVGMMAEASGLGATLDVDQIPAPAEATMGDWLTCFPGFGMVTADAPGASRLESPHTTTAECGELTWARGIRLRWPDGITTDAVPSTVSGLGRA